MRYLLSETSDNGDTYKEYGNFSCLQNAVYFATHGLKDGYEIHPMPDGKYLVFFSKKLMSKIEPVASKGVKESAETTSE